MLRQMLPIGTIALITAALLVVPVGDVSADSYARGHHGYAHCGPPPHAQYDYHRLPPGIQKQMHRRGIPPGHQKKLHGYRYDDRRYHYDRRSYDRSREDYGVIIRSGPRGTSVGIEYYKRR